jgi:hypothetical protein
MEAGTSDADKAHVAGRRPAATPVPAGASPGRAAGGIISQ